MMNAMFPTEGELDAVEHGNLLHRLEQTIQDILAGGGVVNPTVQGVLYVWRLGLTRRAVARRLHFRWWSHAGPQYFWASSLDALLALEPGLAGVEQSQLQVQRPDGTWSWVKT